MGTSSEVHQTYAWQVSLWKDARHHQSLGNQQARAAARGCRAARRSAASHEMRGLSSATARCTSRNCPLTPPVSWGAGNDITPVTTLVQAHCPHLLSCSRAHGGFPSRPDADSVGIAVAFPRGTARRTMMFPLPQQRGHRPPPAQGCCRAPGPTGEETALSATAPVSRRGTARRHAGRPSPGSRPGGDGGRPDRDLCVWPPG